MQLLMRSLFPARKKYAGPEGQALPSESYPLSNGANIVGFSIRTGFAGRRNILRPGLFQNLFRAFRPVRAVRVDRKKDATILHAAFIALCFIFRNLHAN